MKKVLPFALSAALILAACGTPSASQTAPAAPAPAGVTTTTTTTQTTQTTAAARTFECKNGFSVTVSYPDTEHASIQMDQYRTALTIAPAGSGSFYKTEQGFFGKPTTWHEGGNEAMLTFVDPYNNKVETSCNAK